MVNVKIPVMIILVTPVERTSCQILPGRRVFIIPMGKLRFRVQVCIQTEVQNQSHVGAKTIFPLQNKSAFRRISDSISKEVAM